PPPIPGRYPWWQVSPVLRALATFMLCISAYAKPAASKWTLARSEHFEVYSQAGGASARSALMWFEQLRTFSTRQTGLNLDRCPPVRVVVFRSANEYRPYRLRFTSDAYNVGTEGHDYIVMPKLGADSYA